MNPSELNSVFRVAWLAERCGAKTLNDLEGLACMGRGSLLPKLDSNVLDIICSVIKSQTDSIPKPGVCGCEPTKNAYNDGL